MSIVKTEIDVHGQLGQQRMIFYRCQDHLGVWHSYGPVITVDDKFDAQAFVPTVEAKVTESLAAGEFEKVVSQ